MAMVSAEELMEKTRQFGTPEGKVVDDVELADAIVFGH